MIYYQLVEEISGILYGFGSSVGVFSNSREGREGLEGRENKDKD